jgi:hypothetical protein
MATAARMQRNHLDCVQGEMAFARRSPDETAPEFVVKGYDHVPMVKYDVPIHDARPVVSGFTLDREGFNLVKHKISFADEPDPTVMADKYLAEMVPFIKDYFKAAQVVPRRDGVIVRSVSGSADPTKEQYASKPVSQTRVAGFAHIDYSSVAGPMLAAYENQNQGLPIQAYSRLMVIQAWRAVSPPPQDFPLAFCDGTSIKDTDLYESYYDRYELKHKTWILQRNPSHRWYYFPDMTSDEFVLFKGYDSLDECNPRCAHAAFDNRRATPHAHPRRSIEARFSVYFD